MAPVPGKTKSSTAKIGALWTDPVVLQGTGRCSMSFSVCIWSLFAPFALVIKDWTVNHTVAEDETSQPGDKNLKDTQYPLVTGGTVRLGGM